MTSESFPCQCIVPCAPYSSTSTIDTLTANSFIGGLLNFCLVMVIASGKGIIIGYSIGTVLGYLLLIILDTLYEFNEKNGPSIREWWAGRPSQIYSRLCGYPAQTYRWCADYLAQARGWFAARNSPVCECCANWSSSEVVRSARLNEKYSAEALINSDSNPTSVWQNKESSDART